MKTKVANILRGKKRKKEGEELRWQRSRKRTTLSPPQIHQKNI